MPSGLLFLGFIASFIPFLSPAWIILTLTTVFLLGIATSAFIHRRQLEIQEHSFLNKIIASKKDLLEKILDEVKTKVDLTIEKLAKRIERIERIEEKGQTEINFLKAIEEIRSEVKPIKEKADEIESNIQTFIKNEESVNLAQESLDKFQKSARGLIAKIWLIEVQIKSLDLKLKQQMEEQHSEQKRPEALVSAVPHSGSLLFSRVTTDVHHQENTDLDLEERLQTSNSARLLN
ncbi:hypothetical protein [Rickettsiella massiliensis]|uniref:hypothetical protein n=1 Tax=Rickettsiella massiliensis TaxID=676517 RepID=UPI0012EAB73C|nr:hypothetical protein [Rickettsiella massiliensis]